MSVFTTPLAKAPAFLMSEDIVPSILAVYSDTNEVYRN